MSVSFSQYLKRLSVGAKLLVALLFVVVAVSLALTVIKFMFVDRHVQVHIRHSMEQRLNAVSAALELMHPAYPDPLKALNAALAHLDRHAESKHTDLVYMVTGQGRVLLPDFNKHIKPVSPEAARLISSRQKGHLNLTIDGREHWVYYRKLGKPGLVVVVQAPSGETPGDNLDMVIYYTWLLAMALTAVISAIAIWYFQKNLAAPLRRLTKEAERVAGGDLTPPQPFPDRKDELGRLSKALSSMTLTAARMVERARKNELRFKRLFTDSRDAAFVINEDGSLEDINPAALKIFGFAAKREMMSLPDTSSLFLSRDERAMYLKTLRTQGYVQDFPATLQRKDGTTFDALITATLRKGENSRFGLVRDVTRMREAQQALLESEERYRRLLEDAPDVIYRWSLLRNKYDYISSAANEILAAGPDEIAGDPELMRDMVHHLWREEVMAAWRNLLSGRGEERTEQEYRVVNRAGEMRWIRERSMRVRGEFGQVVAIEGILTDITQAKEMQHALIQGQHMVETVLQGLPAAVMVLDRDHRVVHWNKAMESLSGMPAAEMVGTRDQWKPFYSNPRPVLADLVLDHDPQALKTLYRGMKLKNSSLVQGAMEGEAFFRNIGSRDRHLFFMASPIYDEKGQAVRAVETLVDITERKELERELEQISVTDSLTGLFNQRFLFATLKREVDACSRYNRSLSLLLMDLDRFKQINDRFGHLEGDRVLAGCAETVKELIRASDLPCRYGGEEFVVMLPASSNEESLQVALRVREGIEDLSFRLKALEGGEEDVRITVSIGVARYQPGMTTEQLLRRADQAMYKAKGRGRNQVVVFDED